MYRLLDVNCDGSRLMRCFSPAELAISEGDACVVQVDNVREFGHVTGMVEKTGEPDASVRGLPVVLRRATMQDQSMASENVLFSKSARRLCEEKIGEFQLPMTLVRLRYSFDRSRVTVDFTAEERVDFRQLVQALAAETHARVDMRQIGPRDAAGIVGGLAPCGRRLCCSEWLREFENIHVRMAKIQGLSLGPATINGMCGRLKCCLRFEHNCYRDLVRGMPREGSRVRCPEGPGKVISTYVLSQRVKVLLDDNRVLEFDARDLKMLGNFS